MKKVIAVIILLVIVYLSGALYYKDRFPSNVYVNETNIGGMTVKKAENKLAQADAWDKISIKSDTEVFLEIEPEQIDYKYVNTPNLLEIFKQQNEWKWLFGIFKDSFYTTPISSVHSKDKLKNIIDSIEEFNKQLLNAKVAYTDNYDNFIIEPHSYEFEITKDQLLDLVEESIERRHKEVNIENRIQQPDLFDDDKSLILARNKANQCLNMQLTYDFGDRKELLQRFVLKDFITISEKDVDIDPEKVKEYIVSLGRKYDTYGRARKFRTSTGKNITISGGSYGWVIHRGKTADDLIEHIKRGENKIIEPIYSYEALIRDSDDIGNSYVEIDLEQQMVYVYINGELRIKTQTVTGNSSKGYDTPTGVYPLNYKTTDAVLVGEDYASPVKYWMPFNKNIGLHDAEWRTTFGGNIYENNGSHGCVNLPPGNAKTIFDLVYPGMPVIVH